MIARARSAAAAALLALACHGEYEPIDPGFRVIGGPLSVAEGGGTASFQVALATAPQSSVDVDVLSGDATEGLLAGAAGGPPGAWLRLQFTPEDWSAPQAVTVTGVDDALRDGDVSWRVLVLPAGSADAAYATAPGTSLSVRTLDDDTPALRLGRTTLQTSESGAPTDAFEVSLASQPSSPVTVPVWSGDESEGLVSGGPHAIAPAAWIDLVFTPSSWSTPQLVTVTSRDDDAVDGSQVYAVRVGPPTGDAAYAALPASEVTVVNADDDVPGVLIFPGATSFPEGSAGSFSVQLTRRPMQPVSIPISCANPSEAYVSLGGAAEGDVAVTVVMGESDWQVPHTVYVWGRPDFTIDGPQAVSIGIGPPAGDPAYATLPATGLEVTVEDQDVPAEVILSADQAVVWEGGSCATFTLRLSTVPSEPVTVRISSPDPTEVLVASAVADERDAGGIVFRLDGTSFAWARGFEACGLVDDLMDGPQVVTLAVGPPAGDPRYAALPAKAIEVTVNDNDVPGVVVSDQGVTWLREGSAGSLLVRLAEAPTSDVTVAIASSDPAEALLSVAGSAASPSVALIFTPATWAEDQLVTVHGVDDGILEIEPPHPFAITIGPTSSADPSYAGLAGPTVTGTVADDEVIASEGTLAEPVELTGRVPWSGRVGLGSSFYRLTGFGDGGLVRLTGSTLAAVPLTVLDDTPAHAARCGPRPAALDAACAVRLPPGGSFLVRVDGDATYRGTTYTLDAAPFTFATDVPLAIPDPGATESRIALSDVPARRANVALFVDIDHTWDGDLDIRLRTPGGSLYALAVSIGGSGDDYDRTVFFDDPLLPYVSGVGPPFAGIFRPVASLPALEPDGAAGTWTLEVKDVTGADRGTLVRWGIAVR